MNSYKLAIKKLFLNYEASFDDCNDISHWINKSIQNDEIINPDTARNAELKSFIISLNIIVNRKIEKEKNKIKRAEDRIKELCKISSDPVMLQEYNTQSYKDWRKVVNSYVEK